MTIETKVTLLAEVELLDYAPGTPDDHYPDRCGPSDSLIRVTVADYEGTPIDITHCLDYDQQQQLALLAEEHRQGEAA